MRDFLFRLYIVENTPSSQELILTLSSIFENDLKDNYQLEIVDILKNPELALQDDVLATPTLVMKKPLPEKRIMGNICNEKQLLKGLYYKE